MDDNTDGRLNACWVGYSAPSVFAMTTNTGTAGNSYFTSTGVTPIQQQQQQQQQHNDGVINTIFRGISPTGKT